MNPRHSAVEQLPPSLGKKFSAYSSPLISRFDRDVSEFGLVYNAVERGESRERRRARRVELRHQNQTQRVAAQARVVGLHPLSGLRGSALEGENGGKIVVMGVANSHWQLEI